jgi:hypothetical protein
MVGTPEGKKTKFTFWFNNKTFNKLNNNKNGGLTRLHITNKTIDWLNIYIYLFILSDYAIITS